MKPSQIKNLRTKRQLAQHEFAAMLGVDQATISRMETGTLRPSRPVSKLLEILAAADAMETTGAPQVGSRGEAGR